MALDSPPQGFLKTVASNATGDESDYGTDVDEASLNDILIRAESQPLHGLVLASIEQDPVTEDALPATQPYDRPPPAVSRNGGQRMAIHARPNVPIREPSMEIDYDERNRAAFTPSRVNGPVETQREASAPPADDTRSPLARFRTAPKKPLSVTDIVSPAWCEQQYLYSLTKYGRVRKTPAMRQGSNVHKVLEEQVHTEVRVEVRTREDMFGLRMWNVIQGLRTLRATGLTREMEVWGVLDGQVVNGIVDEVSTACPDEVMERKILDNGNDAGDVKKKGAPLDANQRTLTEYLTSSQQGARVLEDTSPWLGTLREESPHFYVVDIKTRQSRSLPPAGAQMRPTQMQLMLYHRLLSSLAADEVPSERIFERYSLDANATFSDTFIAEIGNLDSNFRSDLPLASSSDEQSANASLFESSKDSVTELLEHNSLASLWRHMMAEFKKTLPASQPCLSPLLTVEYRAASSGSLIGRRSFAMDASLLDEYVRDELSWWKGERATKGVEIEEAFKCRICEFAEGCSWRVQKIEEAARKARLRKEASGTKKSEM